MSLQTTSCHGNIGILRSTQQSFQAVEPESLNSVIPYRPRSIYQEQSQYTPRTIVESWPYIKSIVKAMNIQPKVALKLSGMATMRRRKGRATCCDSGPGLLESAGILEICELQLVAVEYYRRYPEEGGMRVRVQSSSKLDRRKARLRRLRVVALSLPIFHPIVHSSVHFTLQWYATLRVHASYGAHVCFLWRATQHLWVMKLVASLHYLSEIKRSSNSASSEQYPVFFFSY